MITEERLEQLLIKYGYDESINNNLKTKQTLLKKGQEDDIDDLLDIIKDTTLDINKCGMVLATGKPKEVNPIIALLDDKVDLNKCLSVLARCKYQEVLDFVAFLEDRKLDVERFLSVIAYCDLEEAKDKIDFLEDENIDIEKCTSVIAKGNLIEIRKMWPILKRLNIDIESCLSILVRNDAQEVIDIIEYLESENLDVSKCPVVLAKGKIEEIKKIVILLKKEHLDINNCLTVLAYGKYDEIVKLIPLLKNKINLNNCLSVLAYAKYEDVKQTIELIEKKSMDISKSTISILRLGYSTVKKIIDELENNNIDASTLSDTNSTCKVFKDYKLKGLRELFRREKTKKLTREDIRFLFVARGGFNKYYNKKQIEKICNTYLMTQDEFINIFCNISYYDNILKNRLCEGKKIWVGNTYPASKKDLLVHRESILKLSKYIAKKFSYLSGSYYLSSEFEGAVLDVIMERCGGIFYNYGDNPEVLIPVLITYCSKWLYVNMREHVCWDSASDVMENVSDNSLEESHHREKKSIFNRIIFTNEEIKFLSCMDGLVNSGINNFMEPMLNELNISIDEYNELLTGIREKITSAIPTSELVKKIGKRNKN